MMPINLSACQQESCVMDLSHQWQQDNNQYLETLDAEQRVAWALQHLPGQHVLSSSFGAQSAVMLHMLTRQMPDIPVILVDTQYLFPETYQFVDELQRRLNLNLKVYRSQVSAAWQEARHGQLWTQGEQGLRQYNDINKVKPMEAALNELEAGTWFSGARRVQSDYRAGLNVLETSSAQRWKFYPLIDWTDRDIYQYIRQYELPYHPLWEQGYVSIGDWHSTLSLQDAGNQQDTRFNGLLRECGIQYL